MIFISELFMVDDAKLQSWSVNKSTAQLFVCFSSACVSSEETLVCIILHVDFFFLVCSDAVVALVTDVCVRRRPQRHQTAARSFIFFFLKTELD